jgi:hypothetical protein
MKYFKFFLVYVLLASCNTQTRQNMDVTKEKSPFYTIDFELCLKSEQPMLLSSLADTIEYIELKTSWKTVITGIRKVIPYKEFLFIRARGCIYKFLRNGQFVRQIGARGQGPGEYTIATDIVIDEKKNEIIVAGSNSLLFYDMDGTYLRSRIIDISQFVISDSVIWSCLSANTYTKDIANAFTIYGDTVSGIPNPDYNKKDLNGGLYYMVGANITTAFYEHNNTSFLQGYEDNDTIWKLSGAGYEPHAYLDMGRYKLPFEYTTQYDLGAFQHYANRYWGIPVMDEDKQYFYIMAKNRNAAEYHYLIYDKDKRMGFIVKDEKGLGITDDILGGPNVCPYMVTDEYYIDVIEGHELLEQMETGKYIPSASFKKQLSTINEDTNQLIILCRKTK